VISTLVAEMARAISDASGALFRVSNQSFPAGGCINHSLCLSAEDGRRCFVKTNRASLLGMFEAEADGLAELSAAHAIRVPRPLTHGVAVGQSFLVMEWLDMEGMSEVSPLGGTFGEQLALMHHKTGHIFGWRRDNTIGSTPQSNAETQDWVAFYRDQRLRPQLALAAKQGAPGNLLDAAEQLLAEIADFFPGYSPQASLLHGDLWCGNAAFCAGQPVLFDPAVFYGDRETDLAMTELFGGFPTDFHAAYRAIWPVDPGYNSRKSLYQLYHLLNHFNLFGEPYGRQSGRVIHRLLSELR
jgi:protein-ribulosamine 3-kinase